MGVAENLEKIVSRLPMGVSLVAVSKFHSDELIMEAYNHGHRQFGENRVQELVGKYERLPKDIEWSMIGHLQRNKVKYIAPFISMIQSVDSLELLEDINRYAERSGRVIDCLLQFHVAEEDTKYGFLPDCADTLFDKLDLSTLKNIRIRGVMGMATNRDDEGRVRSDFRNLREIFERLRERYFSDSESFNTLSMGMSGDYEIAIEEGSTMIRVGSLIFGERVY